MSLYIWLVLIIAGTAVHIEGCSHGVLRSAEILVYADRYELTSKHFHELEPLRRFVEELQNATNHRVSFQLFDRLDFKNLRDHFYRHPGPVNFTPQTKYIVDFVNSLTWRPQGSSAHWSHILILILDGVYPNLFMLPKIQKLKRAGVEIFALTAKTSRDSEFYNIVSYPPKTHLYDLLDYTSPDKALMAMARSVCRSIEVKERHAKKALLSQVRLVDGGDRCQGRVELLYNNTWGWLSDKHWDRHGADVICRQLGCGPSLEALKGDAFGFASGNVLDQVDCTGNERDVSECLLGTWTEPDPSRPQHNAGVSCLSSGVGKVRLVGGSGSCDGIVEVSVNNSWNRFCLWNFNEREASVVCREMGCGPLVQVQENVAIEAAPRWRMVEETHCSGAESQISECSLSIWSSQPCLYNVQAKIVCSPTALSKVALTGGNSVCSGKVKVLQDKTWNVVPTHEWDVEEEAVLCRQLGCGLAIERAHVKEVSLLRGDVPQTNLRSIYCSGHETSLSDCSSILSKGNKCYSGEAEVLCSQIGISEVRLVGGHSSCSGRVEVFYNQAWGTMCDNTWDLSDASVVCRQVGCGPAVRAPGAAYFNPGSGSIWLEKLFCNGTESSISQCGGVISKNSLCNHSQDAGVICTVGNKPYLISFSWPFFEVEEITPRFFHCSVISPFNITGLIAPSQKSLSQKFRQEFIQVMSGTLPNKDDIINKTHPGQILSPMLNLIACIPKEWSMEVYNDSTSAVTKYISSSRVISSIRCRTSVESFIYDGKDLSPRDITALGSFGAVTDYPAPCHSTSGWFSSLPTQQCTLKRIVNVQRCNAMDTGAVSVALLQVSQHPGVREQDHPPVIPCCSDGVLRPAEIIVSVDRFGLGKNFHELESVRRFVEELQNATNHPVKLYLYDFLNYKNFHEHFNKYPGPVNFIPQKGNVAEFVNSMTWRPQAGSGHKSHILIFILHSSSPYVYMMPKIPKLKRVGVEIFALTTKISDDYELYDIVSYPSKTHLYDVLDYTSIDRALSALARSVCRSIELKERHAKKALLSQVRLVDGGDRCRGRVELLYNNTWGWLSDKHWDRHGADVICRQLGCGPSLEALKGDAFGFASGNVLDQVDCTGNERDVSECLLGTWTEPDPTRPQHNAGVSCLSSGVGKVRLVDGSGSCDGIVEVSVNNSWNRFCLWNFNVQEASVVCREMGCGPLVQVQENVAVKAAPRWRMVEETHCSGAESQISECSLSIWSSQPCLYNVQAKIVCSPTAISKVALIGGNSVCSGKVKVLQDKTWNVVPTHEWDVEEEAVLCRQLGCGLAIERALVKEIPRFGIKDAKTNLRNIYCSGHETSLSGCSSVLSKGHSCDSGEAEVLCSQIGISEVRLVGGHSSCSGRVEVFYNQAWGTVCDNTWDLSDASVVCRQVGCGPAVRAPGAAYFNPGSGSIWLEKLFCNGTESSISQCGGVISKNSLCNHSQDAGVICTDHHDDLLPPHTSGECSAQTFLPPQFSALSSPFLNLHKLSNNNSPNVSSAPKSKGT
ncbi:scavenger receptor cysteine-rich type 1 protein M130-like [Leptodactylus fuscus]